MRESGAPKEVALLLTCEHGGNRVPAAYASRFAGAEEALASHRGWDPGALRLARRLAALTGAPLRFATVTRLLVDLNRSPHNPRVFSDWTRELDREARLELLRRYHEPYRGDVDRWVGERTSRGTVLHLGIHSFTPSLNGRPRRPDLSLLYDPDRSAERLVCDAWVRELKVRAGGFAVHRNDPYKGAADGLTTWLRTRHDASRYLGIEVEVNQRLLGPAGTFPAVVARALHDGLMAALEGVGWPLPASGPY